MNDTRKAASLILAEIGMFNEAGIIFRKIEPEILAKISDFFIQWSDKEGWVNGDRDGDYDFAWICPAEWEGKHEESGEYANFSVTHSKEDDSYAIATWCGFSDTNSSYGIQLFIGDFWGGNKRWNAIYKQIPQELKLNVSQRSGFTDQGRGQYFLRIRLDAKELAVAYENDDYDDAFKPIAKALDSLKASISCFTELLAYAEKIAAAA